MNNDEDIVADIAVPATPLDNIKDDRILGEMLLWSLTNFPVERYSVFNLLSILCWVSPLNSEMTNSTVNSPNYKQT